MASIRATAFDCYALLHGFCSSFFVYNLGALSIRGSGVDLSNTKFSLNCSLIDQM